MELKTATGNTFGIQWADVSTFDGIFRVEFTSMTLQEAFALCSNPAETSTLTRIIDGFTTVFNGYTVLKALDAQPNGHVIVALGKE